MESLAIIPARSGSKGLKDKNIKLLNGKPLMAYTIEAALESKQFETVMVSTDSEEYAKIARKYGAEVPFLRSQETSRDTSSTWDTVDEVLNNYLVQGKQFDTFAVLQPTSPLRNSTHIQQAYETFNEKNAKAVVSVCETEHSPLICNTLNDSQELTNFINKNRMIRRQEMQKYYRLNGAIYISDIDFYNEDHYLYREGSYAYIMDSMDSIDIDTMLDFVIAECIIRGKLEKDVTDGYKQV